MSQQEIIDAILAYICERFEQGDSTMVNLHAKLVAQFPNYAWTTNAIKRKKKKNSSSSMKKRENE